jgi:hypothetical protein
MATEREMKEKQEERLYENFFAQEMLRTNKYSGYQQYLKVSSNRVKSGMTAEEIDAVKQRAIESANEYDN